MSHKLIVRDKATADTLDIAAYIAADSPDSADRFLLAAEASFQDLAETPGIGPVCSVTDCAIAESGQSTDS